MIEVINILIFCALFGHFILGPFMGMVVKMFKRTV